MSDNKTETSEDSDRPESIVFDNIQSAFDAGMATATAVASAQARVLIMSHPDDPTVVVPVALVDGEHGAEIAVLTQALEALDARMAGPQRRDERVTLTEVDSFIAFIARWGGPDTVVYADPTAVRFEAVLDDHPAGPEVSDTAWRGHRAIYTCPRSPEWKAWVDRADKVMSQTEFADWIESRLEDLVARQGFPMPTDMLMVARQLNIKTSGEFRRDFDPTSGDYHMVSKSTTEPGSTTIPRAFMICVAIFEGGDRYDIEARVRFTISDGHPKFAYTLHRAAEIQRDAFTSVRKQIAEAAKVPILAGTPGTR